MDPGEPGKLVEPGELVALTELVTLAEVAAAARRVAGVAVRTPLLPSPWSPRLWLKPENLQPTGAFKLRGAYHALARLPARRRAAGVVTHSSGNHGQALAYAARRLGVPCVVVMPDAAAPTRSRRPGRAVPRWCWCRRRTGATGPGSWSPSGGSAWSRRSTTGT